MKIRLHREEFLRQLGFDRAGELPEFVYFDGIPCDPKVAKAETKELFNKHPDVANRLTKMEYLLVSRLYEDLDKPVRREELYKFLNPGKNSAYNTIACHFNNIRRKIGKDQKLSLYFDTIHFNYIRGNPILKKTDNS